MYKLAINRPIATAQFQKHALFALSQCRLSNGHHQDHLPRCGCRYGRVTGNGKDRRGHFAYRIDEATNDVRDKVAAVELPKNAKVPLVSKLDIGGAPVVNVFLTAKKDTLQNLMLFADEKAKPALQKINGVGAINIIGYRDREVKIFPDIEKLNKFGITIRELNEMVKRENVKIGGGKLITNKREFILKTRADALSVAQLENIILKDGIRLRDVAKVVDTLSDPDSYASYNGTPGVMLEVQKISGTNTLEVVRRVKEALPQLQKLAGEKYGIQIVQDTTPFIIHSLKDVEFDLIYGAFLAVIIIFSFLRNFTITVVSALSIPIAIMGTIALMDFMGSGGSQRDGLCDSGHFGDAAGGIYPGIAYERYCRKVL